MKHLKTLLLLTALGAFVAFASVGCEKKGPAEQAGEKVDKAVEKAADKVEEAADKVEEATEKKE
jgi:hypothetical protein